MLLAASAIVLSIVSICQPIYALTDILPFFSWSLGGFSLPAYYASVLYSIDKSIYIMTAFRNDDTEGSYSVYTSLRI